MDVPDKGGTQRAEDRGDHPARSRSREDQRTRREPERHEDHPELRAAGGLGAETELARKGDLGPVRASGLRHHEDRGQGEERDRSAKTGSRPRALAAESRHARGEEDQRGDERERGRDGGRDVNDRNGVERGTEREVDREGDGNRDR